MADPSLAELVVPLTVAVLSVLFVIQRWGTGVVGRSFGPVMVLWFVVLAGARAAARLRQPRDPCGDLARRMR